MEKKWWHHLTAYQIYTRSFCDSNGDGIGDFQGIISKLDYLQELGIGAIWISPFNDSPNYDNGYDISDYYAILKDFGTMADLEEMIQECEKRDIIVMMDLVLNHCSHEHPWFLGACKDRNGKYHDYYIWEEGTEDQPPEGSAAFFGGNVWEWVTGLRLVKGEVQILADNNAADSSADMSASSAAWKAIKASDGTLITPDGNGTTEGSVKLDYIGGKGVWSANMTNREDKGVGCVFKDVSADSTVGDAAKLLLMSLALMPDTALTGTGIDETYGGDYFYFNNGADERCPLRGGSWSVGGDAGVFNLNLNNPRSNSNDNIGGRSALRYLRICAAAFTPDTGAMVYGRWSVREPKGVRFCSACTSRRKKCALPRKRERDTGRREQ